MFGLNRHRWLILFLASVFLLVRIQGLWAEERGGITGKVLNAKTGKPVPYANVIVVGTVLGAAADEHGRFVIPAVDPGRYQLICSAIGYQNQSKEIEVLPGRTATVIFSLTPTSIQLQRLVVTANRFEQRQEEIPATVHVISPEEIAQRNVITVPDAIQYVPGVQVAGNNISIRGSSAFTQGLGTRVLVLLDGVPILSGDDGSASLDAIPVTEISQIEVLKGANSALYGSSAMGGVINIITRTPQRDTSSLGLSFYSGFYSQPVYPQWRWTSSRRDFKGIRGRYATAFGKVAVNIAGSYNQNDGFKENSDFEDWNLFSRLRFFFDSNNQLHVTAGSYRNNYGNYVFWKDRNHALQIGNDPPDFYTRTDSRKSYVSADWVHVFSSKIFLRVRSLYQRNLATDFARPRLASNRTRADVYRRSEARTLRNEVQFNYQLRARSHLVVGLERDRSWVESIQYGKHSTDYLSGYAQLSAPLLQKFRVDVGFRYDAEHGREIRRTAQFNPKLGVVFHPNPAQSFRLSLGRGYRVPTIAERFISTVANQVHVEPNPDLRPERNITVEAGYRRNFGEIGFLDVSLFQNDYWDLIDPQLISDVPEVQFRNITRAQIRGVDLSQVVQFGRQWRLEWGYTYIKTKDLSRLPDGTKGPDYGKEIKYRPNHLLYVRTEYHRGRAVLGADFRYISKVRRVDRLTNIPDITLQVPAYIVDTQATYRWRKWTLGFFVKNLLQYYYLQSPGNLGDLRNYTVRIGYLM